MTLMFAVFFLGILFELFLVLPVLRLMELFSPAKPEWMQRVHRLLLGLWLRLMRILGLLEVLPTKGRPANRPCVFVANHPGLFDIIVLICAVPRMSVMVKNSLAKALPLGGIIKACGYVLSPDNQSISPLSALYDSVKMIQKGHHFFIFPEGTRSPVGGLYPFKKGPFLLARVANVDIQPVLILNQPPFLPKKAPWYYPPFERSKLELKFWEPIPPPATGEEQTLARELESRYRAALGLNG